MKSELSCEIQNEDYPWRKGSGNQGERERQKDTKRDRDREKETGRERERVVLANDRGRIHRGEI